LKRKKKDKGCQRGFPRSSNPVTCRVVSLGWCAASFMDEQTFSSKLSYGCLGLIIM
jgi:hypothetical protein